MHSKRKIKMHIPTDLLQLIKSFLPPPPKPYVAPVVYHTFSYVAIDSWSDVEDVKAYGDY